MFNNKYSLKMNAKVCCETSFKYNNNTNDNIEKDEYDYNKKLYYKSNQKNNNKKYFRKRKLNKRCKKYPTKPKTDKQVDTKYERFIKYNTINYYGNIVDMYICKL